MLSICSAQLPLGRARYIASCFLKSSIKLLNQSYFLNIYETKLNNLSGSHENVTRTWAFASTHFKYWLHAFLNSSPLFNPPSWISCWLGIGIIGKDLQGFLLFETHPISWVKDFGIVLGLLLGGESAINSIVQFVGGTLFWTFCSLVGLGEQDVGAFVYANFH